MSDQTHTADCWRWHHQCAIERIEKVIADCDYWWANTVELVDPAIRSTPAADLAMASYAAGVRRVIRDVEYSVEGIDKPDDEEATS